MVTDVYDFDFLISSQNVQKAGNPQLSGFFLKMENRVLILPPGKWEGDLGIVGLCHLPLRSPTHYSLFNGH